MDVYQVGMYCKHFKGKDLLEKNIYRILKVHVSGSELDPSLVTYTGDGCLEEAKDLVLYENIFMEQSLFAREQVDFSTPLSEEKQALFGQLVRVQPLTVEEIKLIQKPDFIYRKRMETEQKFSVKTKNPIFN